MPLDKKGDFLPTEVVREPVHEFVHAYIRYRRLMYITRISSSDRAEEVPPSEAVDVEDGVNGVWVVR